jgi:hypothetical protein
MDEGANCEMINFYEAMDSGGMGGDLAKMSTLISLIGQHSGEERYFRPAGKRRDNLWELPDHYLFKSKLRLYCLRYGTDLLIAGNGGVKTTKTYQEDPHLDRCTKILQATDRQIRRLFKEGKLLSTAGQLTGQLTFYIEL